MDKRPELNKKISVKDFNDFYWLKEELTGFCRQEGLSVQGGKVLIAQRIEHYLKTGEKKVAEKNKKPKPTSRFDWKNEALTLETVITDNYKNSENVRTFFQAQVGVRFKFNTKFMNWMKNNVGKTLEDAVNEWKKIEIEKKDNKSKKQIAPQFEYNRYIRDFLADNPERSIEEAIEHWKKKSSTRGDNTYSKSDLNLN